MLKGDAPNGYAAVFIYNIMYARVDGVKYYLECDAFAVYTDDVVEELLELLRAVYMQVCSPAQQGHGAN